MKRITDAINNHPNFTIVDCAQVNSFVVTPGKYSVWVTVSVFER